MTVNRAPPAVITSFAGPTGSVFFGSDVALRWTTTNAESVAIVADPVVADVPVPTIPADQAASGLITVNPIVDTTYTLTATGGGENSLDATRAVVVTVAAERMPVIDSFTATPEDGPINQNVTLVWTTTNARSVTLTTNNDNDPVPGVTAANGSVSVRPTVDTTYTLTAIGIDNPANRRSETESAHVHDHVNGASQSRGTVTRQGPVARRHRPLIDVRVDRGAA